MTARSSTARSRDLGMELAEIREAAGHNGQELADLIGWDQSKVSRIENGKQAIDEVDLISWLIACKIKNGRLRQIVERNHEAHKKVWVRPFGPLRYTVAEEEREAKTIHSYSSRVVAGLLQIEDYTRALGTLSNSDDADRIDRFVAHRMQRKEVLRGERAPHAYFFIEENALRWRVGSPQIMYDQLVHLMFMAEWAKLTIRVVLDAVGLHRGVGGSFSLFKRRNATYVAHSDLMSASIFMEDPADIKKHLDAWAELDRLALSELESVEFIRKVAAEWASEMI